MAVIDANALTALLFSEPAAEEVNALLKEDPSYIASVNLAETYDHAIRLRSVDRGDLDQIVDELVSRGRLSIVPIDDPIARRAGELRANHYHRTSRDVSMADCIAAATSEGLTLALATSDPDMVAMAREIGVEVIPLPDSKGKRP